LRTAQKFDLCWKVLSELFLRGCCIDRLNRQVKPDNWSSASFTRREGPNFEGCNAHAEPRAFSARRAALSHFRAFGVSSDALNRGNRSSVSSLFQIRIFAGRYLLRLATARKEHSKHTSLPSLCALDSPHIVFEASCGPCTVMTSSAQSPRLRNSIAHLSQSSRSTRFSRSAIQGKVPHYRPDRRIARPFLWILNSSYETGPTSRGVRPYIPTTN
jgi:hypothetical protein